MIRELNKHKREINGREEHSYERQFIWQIQLLHFNSPFRVLFYCSSEQVIFVNAEYLDIDEFAFFYKSGEVKIILPSISGASIYERPE